MAFPTAVLSASPFSRSEASSQLVGYVHALERVGQPATDPATLWPEGTRDWTGATHRFQDSALREAGFAEVGVVWQDLQTGIIASAGCSSPT